MKCLSMRQPWASLLINGIKTWETRGFKPSAEILAPMQEEGLLIHASKSTADAWKMGCPPFAEYLTILGKLPYGAIIGSCSIGRIIQTESWLREFKPNQAAKDAVWINWCFGDYAPKRWAWEILNPEIFADPIPYKGALSLFDVTFLGNGDGRLRQRLCQINSKGMDHR